MAITISGENNNDRITATDGVIDTISGFNIAGIITASSFTGDLTGDVTGNLTGNVTGNINNTTLLLQTGGTERIRIDSSGRVGLGIDNPGDYFASYNRVVMGRPNDAGSMTIVSAPTYGGYIAFADGTSGNQAYRGLISYYHGQDAMVFGTDGGTERLRITSGGKVAIGTDNPTSGAAGARLVVHLDDNTAYAGGTNRGNGIFVYNEAAGGHSSLELAQRNAADTYGSVLLNAVDPPAGNNYGAEFTIQTRAAGGGSYGERLRITSSGNVGINEDNPQKFLHVTGNTTKGAAHFGIFGTNGGNAYIGDTPVVTISTDGNANAGTNDDKAIFQVGRGGGGAGAAAVTTEHLRVTLGGTVQIGGAVSTNSDIDIANTKLTIKQSANNKEDGIYIERSGERRGHYIYVGGAFGQSDALCVSTNQLGGDTDLLAIDRGGDVRIGNGKVGINATPASRLDVRDTSTTAYPFTSANSGTYSYAPYPHEINIRNNDTGSANTFAGIHFHAGEHATDGKNSTARISAVKTGDYQADLVFGTRNTSFKERLRITSDGNVGIGEDDPQATLHVRSSIPELRLTNTTTPNAFESGRIRFTEYATAKMQGAFIHYDGNANKFHLGVHPADDNTTGNDINAITIDRVDGKVGINEASPANALHISGTTSTTAGSLLRLDAATGDNFIILDNTTDSSKWAFGYDSTTRDQFRMYYDPGSGYNDPMIDIAAADGNLTIDGGTTTLVRIKGDNAGSAGLRLGGDSTQNQCTGFVEVHQDETHGGGMFYNGDGSPAFANSGESADYFSLFRASAGSRHVVQRWFHSSNDCEMFGNLLIDNGDTTTLTVRGNSAGTAGVRAGGSGGSASNQCTGYLEAHQDEAHGGGISYNGDGSPAFVNNETEDHVTFYRLNSGTRERVFSYPYNSNTVNFRGTIVAAAANSTIKSFRITHPHPSKKDTHDLVHSSIEGPQADNIYRGKVSLSSGSATINLDTVSNMTDGTFVLLNRDIQCFTSNETGWGAVKGSVSGNILTITAQDGSSTDTISWMVVGERQDDTIKSSEIDATDANGKFIVEPLKES